MLKSLITLPILLITTLCFAQEHPRMMHVDTNREGYKKWTAPRLVPRFGIGTQKSVYAEVGMAWHSYYYNDEGVAATVKYVAIEYAPTILPVKDKNIFGVKAGYEVNPLGFVLGAEAKFQTDGSNNDFVITPRIGIGGAGIVALCYGYNISFGGLPFQTIGHNQFSLLINLNKKAFKKVAQ